ncbi:MAG TPA: hypothetical protein VJW77_05040 [Terriglobia bacterium]|nr:hypothetical protein [Terriglobia bacterium]
MQFHKNGKRIHRRGQRGGSPFYPALFLFAEFVPFHALPYDTANPEFGDGLYADGT